MKGLIVILCVAAIIAAPGSSYGAECVKPFTSKIGIHLLVNYTPGAKKVIEANCPVIKILDVHPDMMRALRDYKTHNPGGIVVLRIYTPTGSSMDQDPAERAKWFWNSVLWPQLSKLSPAQKKMIDYVEGPNEGETPIWGSVKDMEWGVKFYQTLCPIMKEHGFKPCIANFPVGNPPGNADEVIAKIRAFTPAIRAAKEAGGCWSYHSYSCHFTTDIKEELFYSLRYRGYHETLKKYAPDVADVPMILTEGGIDSDGVNNTAIPGWKREGAEKFKNWLVWFDSEIKKDPYVKGITLFQIGDPRGWDSFDLEPVTDWMADYLDGKVTK